MRCQLCSKPGERYACSHCSKRYHFCAAHKKDGETYRAGHGLRVHPELFPDAVAAARKDPEFVAKVRAGYALNPELWSKLYLQFGELEKLEMS